jgi:hypothetical protein
MFNKILIIIILIIIAYVVINQLNLLGTSKENFREAPPYVERKGMPSTQRVIPIQNLTTQKQNQIYKDVIRDKTNNIITKDYNQILVDETKDLTYYHNDVINQGTIYEDANDIVNQIDKIDYGKVTTGMDKCRKYCSGTCWEGGYTGTATCYPKTTAYDLGTLYKNPTFTYGIDGNHFNSMNLKNLTNINDKILAIDNK